MTIYFEVGKSIRSASNTWYRNVQYLGTGGNSVTFLVNATSGDYKGVLFALKVFRRIADHQRRERFLEEIEFLLTCDHPSIMRIYDKGRFRDSDGDEFPFVVAEYLPVRLHDLIRSNSADIPLKISFSLQLISALRHLESQDPQVVHRDIKPQNIFVKGNSCVLGDFGMMKRISPDADNADDIAAIIDYTPIPFFYRTPDLVNYINGQEQINTKSDIFQLGLVLAVLFTNRNPAIRSEDLLAPVELEPVRNIPGGLGARVKSTIERMLVFNRDHRENSDQMMDHWQGMFESAVRRAHSLNGKVI